MSSARNAKGLTQKQLAQVAISSPAGVGHGHGQVHVHVGSIWEGRVPDSQVQWGEVACLARASVPPNGPCLLSAAPPSPPPTPLFLRIPVVAATQHAAAGHQRIRVRQGHPEQRCHCKDRAPPRCQAAPREEVKQYRARPLRLTLERWRVISWASRLGPTDNAREWAVATPETPARRALCGGARVLRSAEYAESALYEV